jgi:hypothetical protein
MNTSVLCLSTVLLAAGSGVLSGASVSSEGDFLDFTDRHCSSCHNDVDKEGGLDLTSLKYAPEDSGNFLTWVKVHDRVQSGEMPPKEKNRPAPDDLKSFVSALSATLTTHEQGLVARQGRATQRRMNRDEYE